MPAVSRFHHAIRRRRLSHPLPAELRRACDQCERHAFVVSPCPHSFEAKRKGVVADAFVRRTPLKNPPKERPA
jgi:hypothetical protein